MTLIHLPARSSELPVHGSCVLGHPDRPRRIRYVRANPSYLPGGAETTTATKAADAVFWGLARGRTISCG